MTLTFEQLKLHPSLVQGARDQGYDAPTPIQAQAIPAALEGRDLIACAPTGTGKTAAFLLPTLQHLQTGPARKTRALVITPTRELAIQVHDQIDPLAHHTSLSGIAVYGGVALGPQRQAFNAGATVVVATPGRLLDHLRRGWLDLSDVEVLVLDEADRMLDMGFLPDIRRILGYLPTQRQTLLFSATMPQEIVRLAASVQRDPVRVQIGAGTAPADGITQMLYPVPEHLKKPMLLELLGETSVESALVFARTKRRTERLARQLAKSGIATAHIHGDCSQSRRVAALEGFRAGRYRVLVATDVAGRGIDVEGISHVINYDMPDTVEAYVHRAGRTARVEAVGQAISLVTPADESTVRAIERTIDQTIERRHLSHFDYTVEPPSYLGRPAGIALQNRVQQPVSLAERWASMSRGTHRPARRKAPAANRVPGRSGSIPGTSMTTRLFVGNLAYATTEEDLHELFARAGSVQSVALPTDRKTGRPRGFGFVEMSTQEDAHKAISMFDGQTLRDRQIKVNESRPREEGRGGRSRSSSNGRARRH